MQSDVAYLEHFNGRPFTALAALYTEPIHIIARRELGLAWLSEAVESSASLRVAVPEAGSGSAAHALALLDAAAPHLGKSALPAAPLGEALESIRKRELDLYFITSAVPNAAVLRAARSSTVSLLPIDADIARALRTSNPFFVPASISFDAYPGLRANVSTLGTETLLVGLSDLEPLVVSAVVDGLYEIVAEADRLDLPALSGLDLAALSRHLPIPMNTVAAGIHDAHYSVWRKAQGTIVRYAVPVAILLCPIVLSLRFSRVAYLVHSFVLGRVFVLLVAVWLLGSAGMYLLEHSRNSSFRSMGQSSVATLHYLFSGFEEKYPVTVAGNVVAILILSLGVAVATLFTATVVTLLVERALNIRRLRRKPFYRLRGHVIIAGWSARYERVISHLRHKDLPGRLPMVVVTSDLSEARVPGGQRLRGVWAVEGSPFSRDVLRKADIQDARAALILGGNARKGVEGSDAQAVAATLAIESTAPGVYTIAEAFGEATIEQLGNCGCDEIVNTRGTAAAMIEQCVISPGISAVYEELLAFGRGSQEVYCIPVPELFIGRSFRELLVGTPEVRFLPIGVVRGEPDRGTLLNPPVVEAMRRLGAGDELIVLADSARDARIGWSVRRRLRNAFGKQGHVYMNEKEKEVGNGMRHVRENRVRTSRIGICGWNDHARAIVEGLELAEGSAHHRFSVTVVTDPRRDSVGPDNGETAHRNLSFVFGDPTRRNVLESAGVQELESLVVVASANAPEEYSDHHALMVALAAIELKADLHVVVELVNSSNQEHFERLSGVEVVSVEDVSEKMLAQAVITPGITEIFGRLLSATDDSNEIYLMPVKHRWSGKTFDDVWTAVAREQVQYVPLGYRVGERGGRVVLNPNRRERRVGGWGYRFEAEDYLIVLALEEPW